MGPPVKRPIIAQFTASRLKCIRLFNSQLLTRRLNLCLLLRFYIHNYPRVQVHTPIPESVNAHLLAVSRAFD